MTQVLPRLEPIAGGGGDVVLSVQGVSKKFCRSLKCSLWYGVQDIAAEMWGGKISIIKSLFSLKNLLAFYL